MIFKQKAVIFRRIGCVLCNKNIKEKFQMLTISSIVIIKTDPVIKYCDIFHSFEVCNCIINAGEKITVVGNKLCV